VPNGLAFAEFRGYTGWQAIAISHNGDKLALILGNRVMIVTDQPPQGNDAKCGFACHTAVKNRDYVFTQYAKR
jgi:hypothetical protein